MKAVVERSSAVQLLLNAVRLITGTLDACHMFLNKMGSRRQHPDYHHKPERNPLI